jgi:hypothetical protein
MNSQDRLTFSGTELRQLEAQDAGNVGGSVAVTSRCLSYGVLMRSYGEQGLPLGFAAEYD